MIDEMLISWSSSVHEMKRHGEEQADDDDAKAELREQSLEQVWLRCVVLISVGLKMS
jgi:hypothetical protein